jgi:hypothetical protein
VGRPPDLLLHAWVDGGDLYIDVVRCSPRTLTILQTLKSLEGKFVPRGAAACAAQDKLTLYARPPVAFQVFTFEKFRGLHPHALLLPETILGHVPG